MMIALTVLYNLTLCVFVVLLARSVTNAGGSPLWTHLLVGVAVAVLVLIPVVAWSTGVVFAAVHYGIAIATMLSIGSTLLTAALYLRQSRGDQHSPIGAPEVQRNDEEGESAGHS